MSAAEKDINTALSVRLAEIQTAGVPPIAYENAEYTPVEGTLYLRESFLPNIKDAVGVAHTSADDYEGLYQVSVMDWTRRPSIRRSRASQTDLAALSTWRRVHIQRRNG
jgi:hypothetical protein